MKYTAKVTITRKEGMLDPEGTTIQRALKHLGFTTESVNTAKRLIIELEAESADIAEKTVDEMCQQVLANPIIHNYIIDVCECQGEA